MDNLSYREKQVLQYLKEGLTNKQIGEKIFVSADTVATTLQRIKEKMNLPNVTRTKLALTLFSSLKQVG